MKFNYNVHLIVECLTISSDEEDDNRKQKKTAENQSLLSSQTIVKPEEADAIVDKEPIITNSTVINLRREFSPSTPGMC